MGGRACVNATAAAIATSALTVASRPSLPARDHSAAPRGRTARAGGRDTRHDAAHASRARAVPRRIERPALRALLLAAGCFIVYLANLRLMGSWDTIPARMLPISILREGNVDLDEFPWLRRLAPTPYFLVATPGGHVRSRYPIVVPLLATPLYAPAVWWLHHHQVANDDVRVRLAAVVMERIAAAAIAAASVALLFLALCALTRPRLAAGIAVVYGLGSGTWATSSQALWQHGPAELALAGLSLSLLSVDTRRTAVAAGLFAAFAVLARPTMIIFALLAVLFMWRERRRHFVAFCALPAAGGGALMAYNLIALGRGLGGYANAVNGFRWPNLVRPAGLLVSPNRGLLVYTPAAALSVPQMLRWRRAAHPWLPYAAAGVVGYVFLYACFGGWWGGFTYGPRFLIDMLPALALLAAPTVERLWPRAAGRALVVALAAWGIVVQAIGVYCDDRSWDAAPVSVDRQQARVWDWRDPQILRALHSGWQGGELAGVLWQAVSDPRPVPLRELSSDELRGSLALTALPPLRWAPHARAQLDLVLTNDSAVVWPAFSDYGLLQVQLLYTWWRDGRQVPGEGGFIKLPRNLGTGESVAVHAPIDTPARPGAYELEIILAQLLDLEAGRRGNASVRVPVRIE